jgi:hypothetical protein
MYNAETLGARGSRHDGSMARATWRRTCVVGASLWIAACFSKPSEPNPGAGSDAGRDSNAIVDVPHGAVPVVRFFRDAWFSDSSPNCVHGGSAVASPGMTYVGFSIDATGVQPGEVLLLVGTIDNGNNMVWGMPDGFIPLEEQFYGTDNETMVVAWKVAGSNEPPVYSGIYQGSSDICSAAAAISLIAVDGADPSQPDSTHDEFEGISSPTNGTSGGLTTTVDHTLLIWASGADWDQYQGTVNTFAAPSGYTMVTAFGDHGDQTMADQLAWDWTSQMIASHEVPTPTNKSAVTGTFYPNGGAPASSCTFMIALKPAP